MARFDLLSQPVFRETSAFFIYTRDVLQRGRRIGDAYKIVQTASIESIDIDTREDFELACCAMAAMRRSKDAAAAQMAPAGHAKAAVSAAVSGTTYGGAVAEVRVTPRTLMMLVLLTLMTASQSLLAELAKRANPHHKFGFHTASAVFYTEALKFVIAVSVWRYQVSAGTVECTGLERLSLARALPYAVPALLFAAQNNLVFWALARLDPPTYQLWACTKLLSAGVVARVALKKRLDNTRWCALFVLMLGMATATSTSCRAVPGGMVHGILAVVANGVLSSVSNVANEFLLKYCDERSPLFLKNAQLYAFGVLITACGWRPRFHGWDALAVTIVVVNALTGILISLVLRYADNVVKGFSVSAAMLLTTCVSSTLFDFALTPPFLIGALAVSCAFWLYFTSVPSTPLAPASTEEQGAVTAPLLGGI